MKEAIHNDEFDYFICSEFSRISRNDGEIKSFIADCFDREMGVEIVQSSFAVAPDTDAITKQAMKIVADTLANIATMENLQKVDRINRGIQHAREAGKWTRKAPTGFSVNKDGYLQVNVDEYLAIRDALLDHYYFATSWTELGERVGLNRSTLSRIYNDEDRRRLYIHAEGWDKWGRDTAALKDADMDTYVKALDDAPEYIDPEEERKKRRRMAAVSDEEFAMMRSMRMIAEAVESGEELSDEELLEMYEENVDAVEAERSTTA
jgi:DNA invertase Pin-like site-specific DNA recombinase